MIGKSKGYTAFVISRGFDEIQGCAKYALSPRYPRITIFFQIPPSNLLHFVCLSTVHNRFL